jgi:hypothetical protein
LDVLIGPISGHIINISFLSTLSVVFSSAIVL